MPQEAPGNRRRHQELQEVPGGPRQFQEAPRGPRNSRRLQEAPGSPKRPQKGSVTFSHAQATDVQILSP